MRRSLLDAFVLIVAPSVIIAFVRIQPPGFARVLRRGRKVDVAFTRVAFVVPFGRQPCLAPKGGDRLLFQRSMRVAGVDLNINFAYEPPSLLPDNWPSGDWCTSLEKFVEQNISARDNDVLADPRAVEATISRDIQRALAAANLKTSSVSARIQLPAGWERMRPVPEVRRLAAAAPPVLFIGLDGADWQLLDDYMARGIMPNLSRLVREGNSGFLETEHPPLSPIVWTTMMTG